MLRSQDPIVTRMPYPVHPQTLPQPHPPNVYAMGSRMPNFYSGYPVRSPMYPLNCSSNSISPNRGPFYSQFSNSSLNAGSMPPPAVPPASVPISSTQNQQSLNCLNISNALSLPYSASLNNSFGPSSGHAPSSHSNWEHESHCAVPGYQPVQNALPHQFSEFMLNIKCMILFLIFTNCNFRAGGLNYL